MDARIRASAPDAMPQAATNPLSVDQWVDENRNGFIDWLDKSTAAIHRCAKRQPGEMGTVQDSASDLEQEPNTSLCGSTERVLARRGTIKISPVCGNPNRHRLNVTNELSDTVVHEARHAWQNTDRNRSVGVNDDGSGATPRNDDDLDFLVEIVSFPSANLLTEAVSGTGDNSADPDGTARREEDASNHGALFRNTCP